MTTLEFSAKQPSDEPRRGIERIVHYFAGGYRAVVTLEGAKIRCRVHDKTGGVLDDKEISATWARITAEALFAMADAAEQRVFEDAEKALTARKGVPARRDTR